MKKLKLSEAIILGAPLKKSNPEVWLSDDGSCGCAFGGVLLAIGLAEGFIAEREAKGDLRIGPVESTVVMEYFPWLTEDHTDAISMMYWDVHLGIKTIEDVAAYVATIEPAHTPAALDEEK